MGDGEVSNKGDRSGRESSIESNGSGHEKQERGRERDHSGSHHHHHYAHNTHNINISINTGNQVNYPVHVNVNVKKQNNSNPEQANLGNSGTKRLPDIKNHGTVYEHRARNPNSDESDIETSVRKLHSN